MNTGTQSLSEPRVEGEKKALYIGVESCAFDALKLLKETLKTIYGFDKAVVLCDSDEEGEPINKPTKENVLKEIETLILGATSGDILLIYLAVPSENHGHEHQYLCFCDGQKELAGPYWPRMFKQLPSGVTLNLILDTCQASRQFRQWEVERTQHRSGQQVYLFASSGEANAIGSLYTQSMCQILLRNPTITNYQVSYLTEKEMWKIHRQNSIVVREHSFPDPYYLWPPDAMAGERTFLA